MEWASIYLCAIDGDSNVKRTREGCIVQKLKYTLSGVGGLPIGMVECLGAHHYSLPRYRDVGRDRVVEIIHNLNIVQCKTIRSCG